MYSNKTLIVLMNGLLSFFAAYFFISLISEAHWLVLLGVSLLMSVMTTVAMRDFSKILVKCSNPLYYSILDKELDFRWCSDLETLVRYNIKLERKLQTEEQVTIAYFVYSGIRRLQLAECQEEGNINKLKNPEKSKSIVTETMTNIIKVLNAFKIDGIVQASDAGSWQLNEKKTMRIMELASNRTP